MRVKGDAGGRGSGHSRSMSTRAPADAPDVRLACHASELLGSEAFGRHVVRCALAVRCVECAQRVRHGARDAE
eukprot:2306441-Rhodomonas_salina.1